MLSVIWRIKSSALDTIWKSYIEVAHLIYDLIRIWILKYQNVCKANFIINNKNEMPKNKEDINQRIIFDVQKNKYVVPEEKVAILNSFPIFIYEYMK